MFRGELWKMRYCISFFNVSRTFTSGYRSIPSSYISSEKAEKYGPQLKSNFYQIQRYSGRVPPFSEDDKFISGEIHGINLFRVDEDDDKFNFKLEERFNAEHEERFKMRHEERFKMRHEDGLYIDQVLSNVLETFSPETVVSNLAQIRRALPKINTSLSSIHEKEDFYYFLSRIKVLYPQINGDELVRILHYFVSLGVDQNKSLENYVTDLLQLLSFHLNSLSLKKILDLHSTLKKMLNPQENVESLIFSLHILMENHLQTEILSELKVPALLSLCGFCCKGNVKNSYKVFEELGERGLRPVSAVSVLWNILDLPFFAPFFKFMVPPEKEIIIEILAKECLTIMVNNIQSYTPSLLIKTITKVGSSFTRKKDLAYHEYFFKEVSRRALEEDWNFQQLVDVANEQYRCRFMDKKLLCRIAADLPSHRKMDFKVMSLFFPFSCMEEPPKGLQGCINNFENYSNNTLSLHPYMFVLVVSIWSMGYSSRVLLEKLFNPAFIRSILKDQERAWKWTRAILLLNVMMERDPSLSQLCLSGKNRSFALNCLPKEDENLSDDPSSLHNIVKHSSDYRNHVLYSQGILIDKLLVLDDTGRLVPLSDDRYPDVKDGLCVYEILNIDAHHRRIALLNVPPSFIIRPERKLFGPLKLTKRVLQSDGFDVVLCLPTESRFESEEELTKNLLNLGVSL